MGARDASVFFGKEREHCDKRSRLDKFHLSWIRMWKSASVIGAEGKRKKPAGALVHDVS